MVLHRRKTGTEARSELTDTCTKHFFVSAVAARMLESWPRIHRSKDLIHFTFHIDPDTKTVSQVQKGNGIIARLCALPMPNETCEL